MKVNLKKGFTLIELLIVIAIIGILAVALLPSILSAPASARDAAKQAALSQVAVALEQYNASSGSYPAAGTATGECMIPGASGAAQTALKPYFKSGDIPKVDGAIPRANANPADVTAGQMTAGCSGILYCRFSGNRYYLGVVMESPAVIGKGRYAQAVPFASCDSATPAVAPITLVTGASTSVYGILN